MPVTAIVKGLPKVDDWFVNDVEVLAEESSGGVLRFKGTVLVDNAISAVGRYYPPRFNDAAMEATNMYMRNGGIVTMYSRHGKAVGTPSNSGLPLGLPVGKVEKPLWREGNRIRYQGMIFPTSEGNDVRVIIEHGGMRGTSLRSTKYTFHTARIGDRTVDEMDTAVIQGIDLAEEAGIEGAGIDEVLEGDAISVPVMVEEDVMDWTKVTIEDVVANMGVALKAYVQTQVEEAVKAPNARVKEVEDQMATAALALEEAKKVSNPNPALEEKIQGLELQVAIAKSAHIGISGVIATALEAKVKKVEDIAGVLPSIRAAALEEAFKGIGGDDGKGKGKQLLEDKNAGGLDKDQIEMLRLAGVHS